jgi:hypothetical protein
MTKSRLSERLTGQLVRAYRLMRRIPAGAQGPDRDRPHQTQPSRWFAVVAAKKNWERTLKFLAEFFQVGEPAERVAKKLRTAVTGFIYQQVWRGVNVERWADTAAEVGEHSGLPP